MAKKEFIAISVDDAEKIEASLREMINHFGMSAVKGWGDSEIDGGINALNMIKSAIDAGILTSFTRSAK